MSYKENLKKLLDCRLPCEHTIQEVLEDTTEQIIRFGRDDEPWIMCTKCELAWPMWEYNIRLRVER